jgi:Protein of unknown function (DUF5132)
VGGKSKRISEAQLTQVAERVSAQLQRQDASARPSANRSGRWRAYLVGGASGVALALAAPLLRPAMRSTVKGGILIGRYARQVGSGLKEQFEDIVAEAEADLDQERAEAEPKREVEAKGANQRRGDMRAYASYCWLCCSWCGAWGSIRESEQRQGAARASQFREGWDRGPA